MNPFDEIFGPGMGLLTGIRTDVSTIIGAIVLIGFMVVGIDLVLSAMGSSLSSRSRQKYFNEARSIYDELRTDGDDDFDTYAKKQRLTRAMNKALKDY